MNIFLKVPFHMLSRIPHPLCERATIELVETKKIQDVNSVQNWLIEKELESDENYFMVSSLLVSYAGCGVKLY